MTLFLPRSCPGRYLWLPALMATICGFGCSQEEKKDVIQLALERHREKEPRSFSSKNLSIWWDSIPRTVSDRSVNDPSHSNIRRQDYAGSKACQKCHRKNYESWSRHPHRWMNTRAGKATVRGDFSGKKQISYLGGLGTFSRSDDGGYRMKLSRDSVHREYEITQTIGSRFFQYYVGRQLQGPEPRAHKYYKEEHVLPFGYWLDHGEWVPVVHIKDELPDGERPDPFVRAPDHREQYARYASECNFCHTTFPLGDMMVRNPYLLGRHAPSHIHLLTSEFVADSHSDLWDGSTRSVEFSDESLEELSESFRRFKAEDHAVGLGVSCEACHLGAAKHAADPKTKPLFFPSSEHLFVETDQTGIDYGRTHDNLNWACGRCHAGDRPEFAAGMSTWNSTEYSDAMKGSCYLQLTCVDCHNPHEPIGKGWTKTPEQNDASCLKCHTEFTPSDVRVAHTHHPMNSPGSRCMNCHMPRLNEGLQDVVRTHTIFSPTNTKMIESNHPNACNLCHPKETIKWTLASLKEWYGAEYSTTELSTHYPQPDGPTANGWLQSESPAVRLVAADALFRTNSQWALPDLIRALDDDHLLNRQFARIGLEESLKTRLSKFGYQFYMTPDERRDPIQRIQDAFGAPQRAPAEQAEHQADSRANGVSESGR